MRQVVLIRQESSALGTFGFLYTDSGFSCRTGELQWKDNRPGMSCIPLGEYRCNYRLSPKHGMCFHVDGVTGRTDIEIHSANFVGDVSMGLRCQLLGCIAPGERVGYINGQKAIVNSQSKLKEFEADMAGEDFILTIEEIYTGT